MVRGRCTLNVVGTNPGLRSWSDARWAPAFSHCFLMLTRCVQLPLSPTARPTSLLVGCILMNHEPEHPPPFPPNFHALFCCCDKNVALKLQGKALSCVPTWSHGLQALGVQEGWMSLQPPAMKALRCAVPSGHTWLEFET